MKKLSDLGWKETKQFVITLKSQLALITNDDDLKAVIQAALAATNGKEADMAIIDAVYAIVDCLLIKNENALDTIIAACMQMSVEELQEVNNINVIETVIDFLSIDTYKKLLLRAIKSGTRVA